MRFRTILSMATLFLTFFTIAVFAQSSQAYPTSTAAENQSVSGKISAIGDAAFTVAVAKDNQPAQNLKFLVDDQTRMEGRLKVGAQATVEYRSDGGMNIAVHVVVTPSSGKNHN